MAGFDHPIFLESLRRIEPLIAASPLRGVEREVLERLVHSSGDPGLAADLRFVPEPAAGQAGPCAVALSALAGGASILTDTAMAAAAVAPMARRTFANPVHSVLAAAPAAPPAGGTRCAEGMERALRRYAPAVVLIGSAPTALERLLDLVVAAEVAPPLLVIGMPVGFVGVEASKRRLAASGLPQIRLDGSRGGAALVAAALNALLRRAWLDRPAGP
ncbi:MAG: precorrin-8X methylmutase [Synechococcaceae cyanobacterium]|nr:precorrin-8X methylmutase [Synechococcaceae cyanobacterium]